MPNQRKKLIEVALPLEAINKVSAREKSLRHGHPSTLHHSPRHPFQREPDFGVTSSTTTSVNHSHATAPR